MEPERIRVWLQTLVTGHCSKRSVELCIRSLCSKEPAALKANVESRYSELGSGRQGLSLLNLEGLKMKVGGFRCRS